MVERNPPPYAELLVKLPVSLLIAARYFRTIRDTLKNFRAEVEAHIRLGVCPAGVCAMAPEAELELMNKEG